MNCGGTCVPLRQCSQISSIQQPSRHHMYCPNKSEESVQDSNNLACKLSVSSAKPHNRPQTNCQMVPKGIPVQPSVTGCDLVSLDVCVQVEPLCQLGQFPWKAPTAGNVTAPTSRRQSRRMGRPSSFRRQATPVSTCGRSWSSSASAPASASAPTPTVEARAL